MRILHLIPLTLLVLAACGDGEVATRETDVAHPAGEAHSGDHHVGDPGHVHAGGDAAHGSTAAASTDYPDAVTEPWGAATEAYLAVKDAFTDSDLPAARAAATRLAAAIEGADMAAMGEGHDAWMAAAPTVAERASALAGAGDLDGARAALPALTEAFVAGVERLGTGGQTLFVQHCPMAFDNEGADWVSAEREVRNPYFGDAMMSCGRVTQEL